MYQTSFHKSTTIAGGIKIGDPIPYRSDCVTKRGEKEYLEDMSYIDEIVNYMDSSATVENFEKCCGKS